jgi:N-methylhydantoinase A
MNDNSELSPAQSGGSNTRRDAAAKWRLGVDIGGTFTDVVLWREGSPTLGKVKLLTTADDPARAVLDGINQALSAQGVDAGQLERVIHGTTLVANALIERKGVATALVTTAGFRDVLEIGREWRYDLFDLNLEMPAPLVPRPLRLELDERIDANGQVVIALQPAALEQLTTQIRASGARSLGVCLLHGYLNPSHERAVAAHLNRALPDVSISASHEVSPELGEYERTSTTVANAYVRPLFEGYVERLVTALKQMGYARELLLVLSDGRLVGADVAKRFPIRLVQSGPAAGAEAARLFGELAGVADVLCFDMGGTTAKACLIPDGEPERTVSFEVARETRFAEGSGLPLQIPAIDMIEIGAGGGSIARLDGRGLLQVGPDSAGASPGPVCYGLGNTLPTVTDCDLLLGYLDEKNFLGGRMRLDMAGARAAVSEHLAVPLGISVEQAAWGVHETVTANMAQAASIHAIERALDVTRFTMLPIGGAGPVHACSMARKMAITQLVCPPGAGVASAIGMLASSISFEIARAAPALLAHLDFTQALERVKAMDVDATRLVLDAGVPLVSVTRRLSVMMRYLGQGFEIETPVSMADLDSANCDALASAFAGAYQRRYGRVEQMPAEILSWRLVVAGPRSSLQDALAAVGGPSAHQPLASGSRKAWFDSGFVETPVFQREALSSGHQLTGPVMVEEAESTLVVPPNFKLVVDEAANLMMTFTP